MAHHRNAISRFSRMILAALNSMICLAGCVSPALPEVRQSAWDPAPGLTGLRLETAHYDIHTTSNDPAMLDYLPVFMEATLAEYRKLIPVGIESAGKMQTYVFANRPQWAAFTKHFAPRQAHVYLHIKAGGYLDQSTGTTVIWDLGRDRTLSLLAHEGFHQYLATYFTEPVVAWLNEGLATQWESFDLDGPFPTFTPRRNYFRRNDLREALMGENGWIPLDELLSMHAGQAVVQTGQAVRGYYAQVWSLMLFLRESPGGAYAGRLADLLADAGTVRLETSGRAYRAATPSAGEISDGEAIFRYYVTDDLDAFEEAYKTFARSLVD